MQVQVSLPEEYKFNCDNWKVIGAGIQICLKTQMK